MTRIVRLSENVILSIMMYILLKSVLQLRLTCSYMYQVTQCSTFCRRLKIKITRLLYLQDVQFFKNLMEKFGSSIPLEMRYIKIDTFESTLECVQSFTEVTIDLVYLNQLSMHCKYLRKLVIGLPFKVDEESLYVFQNERT